MDFQLLALCTSISMTETVLQPGFENMLGFAFGCARRSVGRSPAGDRMGHGLRQARARTQNISLMKHCASAAAMNRVRVSQQLRALITSVFTSHESRTLFALSDFLASARPGWLRRYSMKDSARARSIHRLPHTLICRTDPTPNRLQWPLTF